MRELRGTPATLDEAIEDAIIMRPACTIKEHAYETLRDFAAQKFAVAYMKAEKIGPEAFQLVCELFKSLTQRKLS